MAGVRAQVSEADEWVRLLKKHRQPQVIHPAAAVCWIAVRLGRRAAYR
jgi:hypothetical protein